MHFIFRSLGGAHVQCVCALQNTDAALLSVVSFPAFAVDDEALRYRTQDKVIRYSLAQALTCTFYFIQTRRLKKERRAFLLFHVCRECESHRSANCPNLHLARLAWAFVYESVSTSLVQEHRFGAGISAILRMILIKYSATFTKETDINSDDTSPEASASIVPHGPQKCV